MMLVITRTNDKNYYDLCSLELKINYEFVSFLIKKFENDISFICEVADYYLKNTDDELTRIELVIKMADLTKGKEKEKYHEYDVIREASFTTKMIQIEMGKQKLNDKYASNKIGMGFLLIFESFNNNKIILNYYAKKMIELILEENSINLENMLHEQFNNPKEITEMGITKYLLNFISTYDPMLASYLTTNINLLDDLKNKILNIQNRWNKYENRNEQKKYNLIFEKVHEYMNQVEHEGLLTENDLLYSVSKTLGVSNKLAKYDTLATELEESFVDNLDEEFIKDTLKVSYMDQIHFNNVKRIISSILFSNRCDTSEFESNEDRKGKILKISFNND